jgi:hypothetical protein
MKKFKRSDDEISKLVEDNVKLAYFFALKWAVTYGENEAHSHALGFLHKAAIEWDESIPFGSYAGLRLKWGMPRPLLGQRCQKRGENQ